MSVVAFECDKCHSMFEFDDITKCDDCHGYYCQDCEMGMGAEFSECPFCYEAQVAKEKTHEQ